MVKDVRSEQLIQSLPQVSSKGMDFDSAIRINREMMLRNNSNVSVKTDKNQSVVIGSVNMYGGSTNSIVNQSEINNSTIIIQNK